MIRSWKEMDISTGEIEIEIGIARCWGIGGDDGGTIVLFIVLVWIIPEAKTWRNPEECRDLDRHRSDDLNLILSLI